ncbi:helix-turn-helix domain-containing protein [Anabaena azotica]|uniref:helix-turn-helix domain-containing protein n=1 Tax=Anabaena azotica TaxID=197653 RepID=UPI0039A59CE8
MSRRLSRYEKARGYRNEPLYTVKETVKILNMDESTLRYHFHRKRLLSFKMNGKRFYTQDSVKTFLNYLKMQR